MRALVGVLDAEKATTADDEIVEWPPGRRLGGDRPVVTARRPDQSLLAPSIAARVCSAGSVGSLDLRFFFHEPATELANM